MTPIKRDGSRKRLWLSVGKGTEHRLKLLAMAAGLTVRYRGKEMGSVGLLLDAIAGLTIEQQQELLAMLKGGN